MEYNRNPLTWGERVGDAPSQGEIAATLGLLGADLDDAVRYGGPVTRWALNAIPIGGKHRYVTVDTKVHMLMPGMSPAIPGWHTDGVPRGQWSLAPVGPMAPNMGRQENVRAPLYHLLVTGTPPLFILDRNLDFSASRGKDLYARLTAEVEDAAPFLSIMRSDVNRVYTWDWWELHKALPATQNEWRFLIRVTESDYLEPNTDLRKIIRTHQQAYTTAEFGW